MIYRYNTLVSIIEKYTNEDTTKSSRVMHNRPNVLFYNMFGINDKTRAIWIRVKGEWENSVIKRSEERNIVTEK